MDDIYMPVEEWSSTSDVVFEGILAQHSARRLRALTDHADVHVVLLSTSLEVCVTSVEARRAARGNHKPLDPANLTKEYHSVISATRKLSAFGVSVHELNREDAIKFVLETLEVEPCAG
jgi:hypothetical protein